MSYYYCPPVISIGNRRGSEESWQHIGNKKSDSPYPMENTDNQNTLCQIAHTKLFKLSFAGASGNEVSIINLLKKDPKEECFFFRVLFWG